MKEKDKSICVLCESGARMHNNGLCHACFVRHRESIRNFLIGSGHIEISITPSLRKALAELADESLTTPQKYLVEAVEAWIIEHRNWAYPKEGENNA